MNNYKGHKDNNGGGGVGNRGIRWGGLGWWGEKAENCT